MKRILIAGDSFSSAELAGDLGWTKLLADRHLVVNISQPGIGEYKILKNLEQQNLSEFDWIIVSHTSPNRVHCQENLLYPADHVYRKSDLLFSDVENKKSTQDLAHSVYDYFRYVFDPAYYEFVHTACCEKIDQLTRAHQVIHITNFDWNGLYAFPNLLNFYELWCDNRGSYVHYNAHGNRVIFDTVLAKVDS